MKNNCFDILAISLWLVFLAVMTGCQEQIRAGSTLPVEATPPPAALDETPSPTPDPAVGTSTAGNPVDLFPYEPLGDFNNAESIKLSGVVYHPSRETLFAVRDNGWIIEFTTDGPLIHEKRIRKKADFEGIAYSPITDMLYVAVEGEETILEIDSDTLQEVRAMPIDRMFEGKVLFSPEGNGIEGITFVPSSDGTTDNTFYLVNQSDELEGLDPSIVFEVELDPAASESQAQIIRYFSVGVTDLAGIHYVSSTGQLLIVSDSNNLLLEVSLTGQVLATYPLPGNKQEGITIDGDGLMYIAQDTKRPLLKFKPLTNANDPNR